MASLGTIGDTVSFYFGLAGRWQLVLSVSSVCMGPSYQSLGNNRNPCRFLPAFDL
jgi:hypothetical protein